MLYPVPQTAVGPGGIPQLGMRHMLCGEISIYHVVDVNYTALHSLGIVIQGKVSNEQY